jgi:general secretion pathway protein I
MIGTAKTSRRRRAHGFTLLEVLVSLAVFALFAVVLGAAYINVLNAYEIAGRSGVRDENLRFARAMLLAQPDREKAERGDDFEAADGVRLHWRARIEPTQTADLFAVTFTCEISDPKAAGTARPTTQTFMLLRPTWSQGGDTEKLRAKAKERILEIKSKRTP